MTLSSKNQLKKILVTGGSGFIGSHLCFTLVKNGHEVLCIDNLFSSSKENINHLNSYDNFEFQRHDVTFPLFIEIDQIYNLACPASPEKYQIDPIFTLILLVFLTFCLLKKSVIQIKIGLFFSSIYLLLGFLKYQMVESFYEKDSVILGQPQMIQSFYKMVQPFYKMIQSYYKMNASF